MIFYVMVIIWITSFSGELNLPHHFNFILLIQSFLKKLLLLQFFLMITVINNNIKTYGQGNKVTIKRSKLNTHWVIILDIIQLTWGAPLQNWLQHLVTAIANTLYIYKNVFFCKTSIIILRQLTNLKFFFFVIQVEHIF